MTSSGQLAFRLSALSRDSRLLQPEGPMRATVQVLVAPHWLDREHCPGRLVPGKHRPTWSLWAGPLYAIAAFSAEPTLTKTLQMSRLKKPSSTS